MDSISKTYSGGTPSKKNNEYYKGDIPFIRSGDINNESTELFISESALQNSSTKLVKKGDVLYALYGATSGEVAISKIQGAINQAILAIIPHKVNGTFIASFLKRERKRILSTYLQGGQGNLSAIIVKNLLIPYTKIEEQKRIEIFLHRLNNLITLNQRKLDKLKKLKEVYLINLFANESGYPAIRFEEFKDIWNLKRLGDHTHIKTGDTDLKDAEKNGKYPLYTRSQEALRINRYSYNGEAILVPGEGRLGDIFHYINGPFAYHQRVYKISDFKGLDALFTLNHLKTFFKRYAMRLQVQATVPSLRLPMLEQYMMFVPILDEQKLIGKLMNILDSLITLSQLRIHKLQKLKQFYLDNLFI